MWIVEGVIQEGEGWAGAGFMMTPLGENYTFTGRGEGTRGGMGLIYFYWTSPSQQRAFFSDLAEGVLNILSLSLLKLEQPNQNSNS